MLASITPLGERGRNSRWTVTMAAFVLGSAAGGGAIGLALGSLGAAARTAMGWTPAGGLIALAAVALAAAVFDLRIFPLKLPTVLRQVDERWLRQYRGWVYGVGFGFQLGLGVVTVVVTASVYAALAAAFLSGSPGRGALIGGSFGLARALTILAVARVKRPDQLASVGTRLRRLDRPSRRAAAVAQLGLGAAALAAAVIL
jgi:hypothetical protein